MITMGSEWQVTHPISANDGFHFLLKCPDDGAESMKRYCNFKVFTLYFFLLWLMQGISLFKYKLVHEAIHISTQFQSTDLWRRISKVDVIPKETCATNNVNIPPIVLEHGAFRLIMWMMKPYGDAVRTHC